MYRLQVSRDEASISHRNPDAEGKFWLLFLISDTGIVPCNSLDVK